MMHCEKLDKWHSYNLTESKFYGNWDTQWCKPGAQVNAFQIRSHKDSGLLKDHMGMTQLKLTCSPGTNKTLLKGLSHHFMVTHLFSYSIQR